MSKPLFNTNQLKHIAKYERYERFYNNTFSNQEKSLLDVDARFYIAANMTKSIVDVTPDFLLGEFPHITANNQETVDQILDTSDLQTVLYDATLSAALKGKSYIKLYVYNNQIKAQSLEADHVIITRDLHGNINTAMILTAIEDPAEDGSVTCLKELHTTKAIKRSVIILEPSKSIKQELPVSAHELTESLTEEEENVFGVIPLVELRNNSKATSDIEGCETLILAINKRLSEIDYIITKHADPKMQVPHGVLDKAGADIITSGSTTFVHVDGIDNKQFKMLEINPEDAEMKYVQPDLNLSAAYEEIDRLINYLLNQTKTSTTLIQSIKDGSSVESGKALRLKFMNTERKLKQKKVFISKAIQDFFFIAQTLLGQNKTDKVDIEYVDILNDLETSVKNAIDLFNAGVISQKEALRKAYPNTTEEMIHQMLLESIEEKMFNQKSV